MTESLRFAIDRHGYSKTARRFDLSFEALKARFGPSEGLKQYEVSRKLHGQGWPRQDRGAIGLARNKYDRGTHEMCQGRVGEFTVLYLIPRIIPATPRSYFRTMF
jgi:hypothetical protein